MGVQVGAWCLQGLDCVAEVCPGRGMLGCSQRDSKILGDFCPSSPSQVDWGLRENSQPGDGVWDRAVRTPGA